MPNFHSIVSIFISGDEKAVLFAYNLLSLGCYSVGFPGIWLPAWVLCSCAMHCSIPHIIWLSLIEKAVRTHSLWILGKLSPSFDGIVVENPSEYGIVPQWKKPEVHSKTPPAFPIRDFSRKTVQQYNFRSIFWALGFLCMLSLIRDLEVSDESLWINERKVHVFMVIVSFNGADFTLFVICCFFFSFSKLRRPKTSGNVRSLFPNQT